MDQSTSRRLKSTATALGAAAGAGAAALAWSALTVNHRMHLPAAIAARRQVFDSPSAGPISFYVDPGRGGRPLLLLHSINPAASAREVEPLFEYFRNEAPLYAPDLPGFGFSARLDREYSPDLYAASLIEVVERQIAPPLGGADVLALGLSSEFAALAFIRRPDLFRSFVFFSPSGFERPKASARAWNAAGFGLWSQAVFDLLVSRPAIHAWLRKCFAGPVPRAFADYAFYTSHQPGARYAPLRFLAGDLFTPDIAGLYGRVTAPVLAIGAVSDSAPAKWRYSHVPGAGAFPHFEDLRGTVAVLGAFWRSLREPVITAVR